MSVEAEKLHDGPSVAFRYEVTPDDRFHVRRLVESTGFFSPEETEVAVELVDERLRRGDASAYEFLFVEDAGRVLGYACYGRIPTTRSSFDLYWIVVAPPHQRHGIGRALLGEVERLVLQRGGTRIYADTSGRAQYASTRAFYERAGYRAEAVLQDFFASGDDKVIYSKRLDGPASEDSQTIPLGDPT